MNTRIQSIMAVTALVVAILGATPVGHAAASMVLPKSSVGTTQLKAGAVTAAKIRNGTLTAAKLRPGLLAAGAPGPQGDPGAGGPQGPSGQAGVGGYQRVDAPPVSLAPGEQKVQYATCPQGKKPIGGGAASSSQPLAFRLLGPWDDAYGATAKNVGTQADNLYVWAICAAV